MVLFFFIIKRFSSLLIKSFKGYFKSQNSKAVENVPNCTVRICLCKEFYKKLFSELKKQLKLVKLKHFLNLKNI